MPRQYNRHTRPTAPAIREVCLRPLYLVSLSGILPHCTVGGVVVTLRSPLVLSWTSLFTCSWAPEDSGRFAQDKRLKHRGRSWGRRQWRKRRINIRNIENKDFLCEKISRIAGLPLAPISCDNENRLRYITDDHHNTEHILGEILIPLFISGCCKCRAALCSHGTGSAAVRRHRKWIDWFVTFFSKEVFHSF